VTSVSQRGAAAAALLALLIAVLGSSPAQAELTAPTPPALGAEVPAGWPTVDGLQAASWVLVEASTGQVLATHRGDLRRPVASTIKILTALTVLDRAEPDELVVVGEEARDIEGASVGLTPGDEWTVEQLLDAIIIRSGNDAAEALAAHVAGDAEDFAELMAEDADRLGLEDAVVVDPSGLTDENLFTAEELATLARVALADPRLRPLLARRTVSLPGVGAVESRNELLFTYPGATGVKTGFTLAAGNSLVGSAERDGRELIAVVLDAGEDPAVRFAEVARLLDHGFEAFAHQTVTGEVRYAMAGGEHAFELAPTPVTTPVDEDPLLEVVPAARPPEDGVPVEVSAGGHPLGTLLASPAAGSWNRGLGAPEEVEGGALLGRAIVDGTYAALRAASAAGELR
jgi:serine-type D-Ala-D-Ala carboxypeptidase (penicillin-binding protein 5/6)